MRGLIPAGLHPIQSSSSYPTLASSQVAERLATMEQPDRCFGFWRVFRVCDRMRRR